MQDSHDVLISPRDAGNKPSGTPRDSKRHSKAETAPPTLWARIGGEEYERRSQIRFSLMATNKPMNLAGAARGSSRSGTFVWTWGAGFHGQLGRKNFPRGRKKSVPMPSVLEFETNVAICQVACGGYHTMALTDDGRIFSWGHGTEGQLGYPLDGFGVQNAPREIEAFNVQKVQLTNISCGQEHSAAVDKRGNVWAWGCGKSGQLGHGNKNGTAAPLKVRNVDHATAVACGSGHTAALTDRGRLFTWGEGNQGQLGHGSLDDVMLATPVTAFDSKPGRKLSCGATLTAVITRDGDLMMFGLGDNIFGPTKEGDSRASCAMVPTHMFPGTKVKQVACGRGHVVMLDEAGDVWCWGSNTYGQLGDGSTSNSYKRICTIQGKSIENISAGRYHNLAAATCGVVYTWGCGESGQLGHNGAVGPMATVPKLVNALVDRVCGQITCGEHHNCIISSGEMSGGGTDWLQFKFYEEKEHELKTGLAKKFSALTRANMTEVEQLIQHHVNINQAQENWPDNVPPPDLPASPWNEDGSLRELPPLSPPSPSHEVDHEAPIIRGSHRGQPSTPPPVAASPRGRPASSQSPRGRPFSGQSPSTGDPELDRLRQKVSNRYGVVLGKLNSPSRPSSGKSLSVVVPASPAITVPSRPQTSEGSKLRPQPPSVALPKSPMSSRASVRFLLENANLEGPSDNAAVQRKIHDENMRAEAVLLKMKYEGISDSVTALRDKQKSVYAKRGPAGPYEGVLIPRMLFFSDTERLLQHSRKVTQSITMGPSHITRLQTQLHRLRLKHDTVVSEAQIRTNKLARLKTEAAAAAAVQRRRDQDDSHSRGMLKDTKTLLESVLARVDEVSENIQSSMFVIAQLRQEAVDRADTLDSLQSEHDEGSALHRRLGFIEQKATLMAQECDSQLQNFVADVKKTQESQVQQVAAFRGVLDEREDASRQAHLLKERKAAKRERERLQAEKEHMRHMASHMANLKEATLDNTTTALREEYFRRGFVRIREASKMESVDDIIDQHFKNKDTKVLLEESQQIHQQRLSELQAQRAVLSGQVYLLSQSTSNSPALKGKTQLQRTKALLPSPGLTKTLLADIHVVRTNIQKKEMVLQELIKDVSREKTTLSKIANAMAHLLVRPLPALRKQTDLSDDRLSVVSAGAHGPDLPGRRSAD